MCHSHFFLFSKKSSSFHNWCAFCIVQIYLVVGCYLLVSLYFHHVSCFINLPLLYFVDVSKSNIHATSNYLFPYSQYITLMDWFDVMMKFINKAKLTLFLALSTFKVVLFIYHLYIKADLSWLFSKIDGTV